MAIRNIRISTDEVLRKTCKPIKEITPNLLTLLDDMADTMYQENAVGLAPPQVGILKRPDVIHIGDRLEVYDASAPDVLIADWFTTGLPLRLSAEQFGKPKSLLLRILPSEEKRYFDLPVPAGCTLSGVRMSFRFCREV